MKSKSEFKIERNIPMPSVRPGTDWSFLKALKVGDSVAVPANKANALNTAAYYYGIKITRRRMGKGLYRVWRVE